MNPSTIELWRGPSSYNGAPIVVLATGLVRPSVNRKTGAMVQTYILRQDRKPVQAVKDGTDSAVCGDCPLRPSESGSDGATCYVNTGWLASLWQSWKNGNVPAMALDQAASYIAASGLPLRVGAYGDPGMVPTSVWAAIQQRKGTGYSHQWAATPELAPYAMASVQTVDGARAAQSQGWRTYRVDAEGLGPVAGEIECPEATTNGRVKCAECGLCKGATLKAQNIVIQPIGR